MVKLPEMGRPLFSYIAFGWLTFIGVGHFCADVLSQYLRHKRAPSLETTLYYGLNSAYALGQVALGVFGLWFVARVGRDVSHVPLLAGTLVAIAGWFAIAFTSMEYWEPKAANAVTALIFVVALVMALRRA